MKLENVFMLLPNRTVGFGSIEIEGDIASVMSDSVRPHRRQPTRLPRPWDSPVKNTGVGCHFLLQCMKVKSEDEVAQSCPTLSDPSLCVCVYVHVCGEGSFPLLPSI